MNHALPRRRQRPLSPHRRILFVTLTILLMTVFCLVFGEIMVRLLWPIREPHMHPWPKGYLVPAADLTYALAPNYPQTWMTHIDGKTLNLVYTNALGMRDVEVPPPDGKALRVLAVGCSQTEGMAISNPDQPWPRQLQRVMNEAAQTTTPARRAVVVMNGGVSGYNAFQEVQRAVNLHAATRPDVWLLAYYQAMWGRSTYGPVGQFTMQWGTIFNREILEQIMAGRSDFSRRCMDYSMLWRWCAIAWTKTDFALHPVQRPYGLEAATKEALRRFMAEASACGAVPIVCYIPDVREMDNPTRGGSTAPLVAPICRALGLPFLDPTPAMRELGLREKPKDPKDLTLVQYWTAAPEDPHYNPRGNADFARALAPLLAKATQNLKPGAAGTAALARSQ